ncbi:SMP-30/gluconolactonase/LRE family protein [Mesorhizobium sp. ASY16-5R]|uniref:SMP-30/gluconolactonase/LRE family protein n=1 Tax=Mesorhizobium sp. ASY16-5R TaxID=3445772 RepID=UPI003F9FA5A2
MTVVREVYAAKDKLGEVPVWDVAEQALYWVDIEGSRLRRLDHTSGKVDEWTFLERIRWGCAVNHTDEPQASTAKTTT